ncbi:MAG: glycosyltransferase family 39 protein [bacterium]|nr:glycosyltransferase family 39 protein [bacterium]
MTNRLTNIAAVSLLVFVFAMAVFSMRNDSLTMDELAHLPAGYSYLTQKDMRLNPEHPPLVKDLAAFPLLFIKDINFPSDIQSWKDDVNGQWAFGNKFLFWSGNPTEEMIFWGRLPMVFILLLLGFYVFKWARELYGNNIALLALFLFSFSPTLLAHGRLVTTDIGAALGITAAAYYFLKFLKESSKKNLLIAGLVLGLALLTKFSTILLLPFLGFLLLIWLGVNFQSLPQFLKSFIVYGLKFLVILVVASAVIWLVYYYHVFNYPPDRQANDMEYILGFSSFQGLRQALPNLSYNPVLRPIAQYLFGLIMVFQRGVGGNTTYFLGEVSNIAWKTYFPIVYLIKEPLAFFILAIFGILAATYLMKKPFWQDFWTRLKSWVKSYFVEFSFLAFIGLYWLMSLTGNLNIGVRHLLPIFPFMILLASRLTALWIKPPYLKAKMLFLGALLCWQAVSVVNTYPSFLAYFNELAGGPNQGYVYVTDSNLDWGQDLKRLNQWLEKNKIPKIYVDYFGGSDARFYLGDKYLQWWSARQPAEMTETPYLAVSATFLQSERGLPSKGFSQPTGRYLWLDDYQPVAKAGYSIFVYKRSLKTTF